MVVFVSLLTRTILNFPRLLSALAGGFIAAALAEGFQVRSWPAIGAIFLVFAVVTHFSATADIRSTESEWWHI
jgi:hypothetical protein